MEERWRPVSKVESGLGFPGQKGRSCQSSKDRGCLHAYLTLHSHRHQRLADTWPWTPTAGEGGQVHTLSMEDKVQGEKRQRPAS